MKDEGVAQITFFDGSTKVFKDVKLIVMGGCQITNANTRTTGIFQNSNEIKTIGADRGGKRQSRGNPIFYFLNKAMRVKYPSAQKRTSEIIISKHEYDMIIKNFYTRFDPLGRLRMDSKSKEAFSLNSSKISGVRMFLIKMSVLNSTPNSKSYYGNKKDFIELSEKAWEYLKQREFVEYSN